ncbi:tetratricopeptide repeat protein, partial [bacterium]|nr:tetratricopeptide repeat protein [bacterium]
MKKVFLYLIIFPVYMFMFQGCITMEQSVRGGNKHLSYDTEAPFLNPKDMSRLWENYDLKERNTLDREIKSYYEKIKLVDPTDELYADLGLLLYQRCRLDEAVEAFKKAIEIEPYEPEYFYLLACAYFFSKRYDLTNQNIKRAKQLGFNINPEIIEYFRGTVPAGLDYLRAKIKLNLEDVYDKKGLYIKNVSDVLNLSEDEIDLATVFLILSYEASEKIYSQPFDKDYYMRGIDIMVRDVLSSIGSETRPSWLSSAISNYMFHKRRFRAVVNQNERDKFYKLGFMNYVLLNGKGTDLSLSLIYLSVAQRLRLPVYGVSVPSHFFVRYDDMVSIINIEMTDGGKNFDNEYYQKEYPFSKKENNIYLKNLSKFEVIGYSLN